MAFALLDELIRLQHPNGKPDADVAVTEMMNALAMVAELRPETAAQAMLAVQMIGAHKAAMRFLQEAVQPGSMMAERSGERAIRLMRLFTDQAQVMQRLKGHAGQQRVVVEHVSVAAGGQAIVGAVTAGAGESGGGV